MTEITITVLGLIQGVLAMLNKRSNWIVYAVQMALLVIFSFRAHLYGDMIQSAVYMFVCLFSFWSWKNGSAINTTHIKFNSAIVITIITLLSTAIFGYILSSTDDPMPYIDAFTTVTTVVALLMMSAHKVEY